MTPFFSPRRGLLVALVILMTGVGLLVVTAALAAPRGGSTIAPVSLAVTHDPAPQQSTHLFTVTNGEEQIVSLFDCSAGAPWYTVTTPADVYLDDGESAPVTLTLDSAALPAGEYTHTLCVRLQGKFDAGWVYAPVTLTVGVNGGEPNIVIPTDTFSYVFGPGSEGTVGAAPIANSGTLNLNWTLFEDGAGAACDAPSPVSWFTPLNQSGTVAPGSTGGFSFFLEPEGLPDGSYTVTACIQSNDPDTPLATITFTMLVDSTLAPDIEVSPTALARTLPPGQQASEVMTVANVGTAQLYWEAMIEADGVCEAGAYPPWFLYGPDSGFLPAGESDAVLVQWNSAGLPPGLYTTTLCFFTDDPDEAAFDVPVRLLVDSGAPTLTPTPTAAPPTSTPSATASPPATVSATASATTTPVPGTPTATATATPQEQDLYLPLVRTSD